MQVEPVTLEGELVRLEPAAEHHAASLSKYITPETFRYFVTLNPKGTDEEAVKEYIRGCWAAPATLPFAIVLKESGAAIGMSCYLDIRSAHLMVEIGMTWIGEPFRGTKVNPEIKLLMMRHAFETLGCQRVQLKTDGRNLHSQAAIKKLGARYEGTLRQYGQMADGFMRDTVMFSVLPTEWPEVKAGLLERLK
jgi:RimJ/RimL family protein N-acetyltransferase